MDMYIFLLLSARDMSVACMLHLPKTSRIVKQLMLCHLIGLNLFPFIAFGCVLKGGKMTKLLFQYGDGNPLPFAGIGQCGKDHGFETKPRSRCLSHLESARTPVDGWCHSAPDDILQCSVKATPDRPSLLQFSNHCDLFHQEIQWASILSDNARKSLLQNCPSWPAA